MKQEGAFSIQMDIFLLAVVTTTSVNDCNAHQDLLLYVSTILSLNGPCLRQANYVLSVDGTGQLFWDSVGKIEIPFEVLHIST